ncbi:unnamed protein product [Closterium sp. NIES-53]
MNLMTCTRPDLAYPLSLLARYVAPGRNRKVHWDAAKRVLRYLCTTQRSLQGYTFSLGSGSISWRSTRSSSVLSSSCEAEIYVGAMAAQELRWLTYLLTDLGEQPRSPPVLYVDNKAMIALCQKHRLEHRTKHIALRYFLARELQQRGQLRLAYVATWANTVDVFTKALPPAAAPHCPATTAPTATAATATMASPTVLTFDAEGRAVDFDVWVDDLQLFLQCESRYGVSLFDHTSDVSTAPAATADSTVCSQWTTRDAVARLAVRSHLPPAERAHFGQYKTAQSLYDVVVARYSSLATAALSRLMLPYLFPDLAAFATVADLITHLCTSDAHYSTALPADSSCEAEIYAGAMAAQELRWLTYLLTDLGEAPRSPPVLYVDNKAMLALCQEHRLEHKTKHIALCYFLARELQQRGQLRLAYVASQANTADVFTKALQPCDHQRFCTVLGLVPTVPHLLTS